MEYKIFGCKVNKYYTEKWLDSEKLKDKKGIFIASCVVTDKAKRKWIKFVRETIIELEEGNKIYISGCGAFKDGRAQSDFFELYPELENFKDKIEILGEDPNEKKTTKKAAPKLILKKLPSNIYTKKFILIQGGCDSFCTFCLTVIKRGRHFYRSKEEITNEIISFESGGGKEVVLTGVNLSAWGLETTNDIGKSRIHELIKYILDNTKIQRLRISSMGPEFVDDRLLELFKNPRLYPHFHFSVQSGSSKILKSMSRHYDGKYIKNLLLKCRNIEREDGVSISLGADIIVGFPGETGEDFMETYNLIKEVGIQKVHAFPFSEHEMGESVPAGKFSNQVPGNIKKDRMNKISDLSEKIRANFIRSQIGKELEVLIESEIPHPNPPLTGEGIKWKGWTQNYIEANNDNFEIISGEIKRNEIVIGKLKKAGDKLLL